MTGFGNSTAETPTRTFIAEVRTLNSKGLDLSLRLPRQYMDKEMEVRNLVGQALDRGKISVYVDAEDKNPKLASTETIDKDTIRARFATLADLAKELNTGQTPAQLLDMAFRWPAASRDSAPSEVLTDEQTEWPALLACIQSALASCNKHRSDEGTVLEGKLLEYANNLRTSMEKVRTLEPHRAPKVRQRLEEKLADFLADGRMDHGRLEQEMIFHVERLDMAEELVRLENHLNYLAITLKQDENPGKKLGFLAQEIGREINTIGSKANDGAIQQTVVGMKEELEKIKEQSLNIL